jgi:hypothetical protein
VLSCLLALVRRELCPRVGRAAQAVGLGCLGLVSWQWRLAGQCGVATVPAALAVLVGSGRVVGRWLGSSGGIGVDDVHRMLRRQDGGLH